MIRSEEYRIRDETRHQVAAFVEACDMKIPEESFESVSEVVRADMTKIHEIMGNVLRKIAQCIRDDDLRVTYGGKPIYP